MKYRHAHVVRRAITSDASWGCRKVEKLYRQATSYCFIRTVTLQIVRRVGTLVGHSACDETCLARRKSPCLCSVRQTPVGRQCYQRNCQSAFPPVCRYRRHQNDIMSTKKPYSLSLLKAVKKKLPASAPCRRPPAPAW